MTIYNTVNSIYKKMNRLNVLELHIDLIQDYVERFFKIDKLTESYISELIFEGYSLKFLNEWWSQTFTSQVIGNGKSEEDLKYIINKFRELSNKNNNCYEIILKVSLPNILKKELREYHRIQISNIRNNQLHQPTTKIVKTKPSRVVMETLNI